MNKLTIFGIGALALMNACNSKPSNEYTINGTTDMPDGELVFITYMTADSTYQDSCAVANGVFSFMGTIEKPQMGYISLGKLTYMNDKVRPFMLEPGTIAVALTGDNYNQAEVTGSYLTEQMDSLNGVQQALYGQVMELRSQFAEAQSDTAAMATIEAKYNDLMTQIKDNQINYVKTHTASMYSPIVMSQLRSNLTLDELKEIYNNWTPEVQAADEATGKYITALENVQPGAKAPEITGKDQNGNDVSLSGLKGKVVLLDFWATWCGPCRASLPHVKEVFEKYHDKGLEVLAVSLDRTEEPWKEYIATSGMGMENYVNVYDAPVKNAENYAIQFIPSKFIIDAEGNMVGRFDDAEELDAKLAEMLGE